MIAVIDPKDKRSTSKREIEYLIHFQGWNASWDRRVGEEFVLKDSDEHRLLQKSLADQAQLQMYGRSKHGIGIKRVISVCALQWRIFVSQRAKETAAAAQFEPQQHGHQVPIPGHIVGRGQHVQHDRRKAG